MVCWEPRFVFDSHKGIQEMGPHQAFVGWSHFSVWPTCWSTNWNRFASGFCHTNKLLCASLKCSYCDEDGNWPSYTTRTQTFDEPQHSGPRLVAINHHAKWFNFNFLALNKLYLKNNAALAQYQAARGVWSLNVWWGISMSVKLKSAVIAGSSFSLLFFLIAFSRLKCKMVIKSKPAAYS